MADIFNANNFVIDKVRRVTRVNLDSGLVDFTITNIESPQVEFTGESTDKTDAQGILLARFDTAKGATFSAETSLISIPLMASQLGTEAQIAGTTDYPTVSGKIFEVLKVKTTVDDEQTPAVTTITATMSHTPTTNPKVIYILSEDKNIDTTIDVGAEEGDASISGDVITFPDEFEATSVGVLYEYETEAAIKVVDGSQEFAEAAEYIVDILAADVCNPATKRAGALVFPKAKIDNNFTINLTTEGTHPFSFTALKDYCSEEEELCYLIFNE